MLLDDGTSIRCSYEYNIMIGALKRIASYSCAQMQCFEIRVRINGGVPRLGVSQIKRCLFNL